MSKRPAAVDVTGLGAAPVRPRRKASSEIIDALRHGIASGDLQRGQRLPSEGDLAAHFSVSQPTVREGLRVLEAMGLVEVRHGSGAYVTGDPRQFMAASLHTMLQMDRVGIIDIVEMRTALAEYSASRVVRCATDDDLEVIEAQESRLEEAAQLSDFHHIADAAVAFQVSVSAAAHNPLLLGIESVLAELLVRLQVDAFSKRSVAFWRKWSLQFASDRQELIASFRARDEDRATRAMRQYLDRQRARFSSDKALAEARVSDPEVLRVIQPLLSSLGHAAPLLRGPCATPRVSKCPGDFSPAKGRIGMTLTGTDRTVFDFRAEYAGRLARVRSTMAEAGVDALLVADTDDFTRPEGGNVRFLANVALPTSVGAPIALVAVVPREGEPTLIVPPTGFSSAPLLVSRRSWIERVASPPPMPFLEAVKAMGGGARPGSATADLVVAALEEAGLGRSRIGLCGTFAGLDQARELLPAATFVPATVLDDAGKPHDVVEYERTRTKTAYEVGCIRQAQACVEAGMQVFEQVVVDGMPYTEAVAEVSRAMIREGAEETFCPASRGRGPSGTYSLPGWSYGTYAPGDMIAFELNARVAGYWAQLPRSWVVGGKPDRDQNRTYDCAWRAFEVMRDRLAVGVTGAELWDAAHAVVSGAGMEPFGRYGHGMGLSQAEWFSVLAGDERRVQEGQSVVLHGAIFDPATGNEALIGEQFVMQDGQARPISTASLVKPALSRVVENA